MKSLGSNTSGSDTVLLLEDSLHQALTNCACQMHTICLQGMHINDSKTPFDSHRDRHENIGRGTIPLSTFRWIMNNPAFEVCPC